MLLVKVYNYPIFPSEGKYSSIKNPRTCNWPVKIAIPVNNKMAPPTFVIAVMYFTKLFEKNKNLSINTPEIIKGKAKPKE